MASFSSSGVSSSAPNTLANIPDALIKGQTIQTNALANATTQQNLDDRATFRANAGGLLSRDPTQTAAAFGADPNASVNYLATTSALDQDTRLQYNADQQALGQVAGALINQPPAQRLALWAQARQQLIAGGHINVPGPDYPGDAAMLAAHNAALSVDQQFDQQKQALTTTPQSPMQTIPGGATPPAGPSASAAPTGAVAILPWPGGKAAAIRLQ